MVMNQRPLLLDDLDARSARISHTIFALDLFCGAGGFTAGLLRAGIQVLAGIDLWEPACATYRKNFDVPAHCIDICNLTADEVCRLLNIGRGMLDLIVGVPPIPWASTSRISPKRPSGAELLLKFARLVTDLAPRMVLVECPDKGSAQGPFWIGQEFTWSLNEAGYQTQTFVLNAAQYGVPQLRRRRYIVGQRRDQQLPFICPDDLSPSEPQRTVWEAIGALNVPSERVEWSTDPLHYVLPFRKGGHVTPGYERDGYRTSPQRRFPRQRPAQPLRFDQPAPSISTDFIRDPRFIHPHNDRPITLREAARLQTFSDDFDFTVVRGRTSQAKLIGGATPPRLAYVLGRSIANHLAVETRLAVVGCQARTAMGSPSNTWGTLVSEPFELLPKPSPALRYLLSADGATCGAVVSHMLRDLYWSPMEYSPRDEEMLSDDLAEQTIASVPDTLRLCELIGLCYQDEAQQIHVTKFGTTLYRWLNQLNEGNSRLLCSYAVQALASCQLDSPVRRLSDTTRANILPFICIWRALQALDGWLSTEELNRALFHVMTLEELEPALLRIAHARTTQDMTHLGTPAIPLDQATSHVHSWMSLASFGWTLCSPEYIGTDSWRYHVRPAMAGLLKRTVRRLPRTYPFSTVQAYVTYIANMAGVPEDLR